MCDVIEVRGSTVHLDCPRSHTLPRYSCVSVYVCTMYCPHYGKTHTPAPIYTIPVIHSWLAELAACYIIICNERVYGRDKAAESLDIWGACW